MCWWCWCWVQSQALMPQTSVLGLLVAMPLWSGVAPTPFVIVLSPPFPFLQLGRGVSLWPGVCLL